MAAMPRAIVASLVEQLNDQLVTARQLWNSTSDSTAEALLCELADSVHAVLLLLGGTGTDVGHGATVPLPAFPCPRVEHDAVRRALLGEVSMLEAQHAHVVGLQHGLQRVLAERDQQMRYLRLEAERDEAEITRLKRSQVQPHALLHEAEEVRRGAVAAVDSLQESFGWLSAHRDLTEVEREAASLAFEAEGADGGRARAEGGGAGATRAAAAMAEASREQRQERTGDAKVRSLGDVLGLRWTASVQGLERQIVRDKDLEREAALQAQAARARLELDAAVSAATQSRDVQHAAALPSLVAAQLVAAVEAARAEERAAVLLQRSQRARAGRHTIRQALHLCAAAVREASEHRTRFARIRSDSPQRFPQIPSGSLRVPSPTPCTGA